MKRKLEFSLVRSLGAGACVIGLISGTSASAYDIVNRWSATQIDGGGLQRGDPVTLRWSVVPDGQSYSRSNNSQLIKFLDDGWNVPAAQRVPDLMNRAWWSVINNAYQQYARVSGITMVYVPEQDASGGDTGMEGDIRIGGESFAGTNVLADNTFPDDGDMRINTTRETDGSVGVYFRTEPRLRNLVIHESGHGVGLGHVEFVNNSAKAVMEPGIRTDIWGLQFDDAYGLNRQYGDPRERSGGNNSAATASVLGSFAAAGAVSWGTDAVDSVVEQFDDDWLGIDGSNDNDWFRFTLTEEGFASITVTPVGPNYTTVQQGDIHAAAMSDLFFQFFSQTPNLTLITTADQHGIGFAESIPPRYLSTAGDYLIRVRGHQDLNQFYQLDLTISDLPAPGTSADLNLDGQSTLSDWSIFVANSYADLTGLGQLDAFQRGDLDGDGDNDFHDFRFFKSAFDAVNGVGAFASILQVPEPQTLLLVGLAAIGCRARWRRARAARRRHY